ncbi:MAG: anthranilate synthase component I family protein [Oscillospiraceae bacterium]|jgi:anthranilate synthase component 1|nr:anthranilate synthase component I family protein [Oscillospiraceae bacterium]
MIRPTLEEAKAVASGCTVIPIALEIYSDIRTPIEVLKTLKAKGKNAYILESVESGENWGRYTVLGYNPSMTLIGGHGTVTQKTAGGEQKFEGNPHTLLKQIVQNYRSPRIPYFPAFTGGFVGYFDYDYTRSGGFCLMMYRQVIAFDHQKQKIFLITNIETDRLEENYIAGVAALKDMESLVAGEGHRDCPSGQVRSEFAQSFSKEAFMEAVDACKRHIAAGDVSQVVPSLRFTADFEGDLLQVYRTLRTINPSSYMFCIEFDTMQMAGASPETLVSLKNGVVRTYPLAGTCKRTEDEEENKRLLEKLLSDPKELSEHEMLVELGKEDLGKICYPDSVKVEEYRSIKTCSHVYHIESKVRGTIRDDCDAFDAMSAALPAGTLSGAPREQAMEIIADLEGEKRGAYGGAVGYIDFTGDMDLCIGIRMAVLKDGKISVQAGAGIVAESIPENEYNECRNKAKAMLMAIKGALK